MAHLVSVPGLGLAVEVETGAGLGCEGRPIQRCRSGCSGSASTWARLCGCAVARGSQSMSILRDQRQRIPVRADLPAFNGALTAKLGTPRFDYRLRR